MTSGRTWPPTAVALGLLAALILFRSLVFVGFEQSHFDSDQAIVGLMARDLATLRAFPLFFYGQTYLLAFEAWLATPLLAAFGVSVFALKLALLAENLAVGALLFSLLRRDVRLGPFAALAVTTVFAIPPVVMTAQLTDACGGNVEPFLFLLLAWRCRRNVMLFGLCAAVGFMVREFVIYGVLAILLIEWVSDEYRDRPFLGRRVASLTIVAAIVVSTRLAASLVAPNFSASAANAIGGPMVTGPTDPDAWLTLGSAGAIGPTVVWVTTHLGAILGIRPTNYSRYGINSALESANSPLRLWAWAVLSGLLVFGRRRSWPAFATGSRALVARNPFVVYLGVVGLLSVLAYVSAVRGVQDTMQIRYVLLFLLAAVGAVSAIMTDRDPRVRQACVCAVGLVALTNVWDHSRLLAEYVTHAPPGAHRELTDYLVGRGVRYASAPYWTAYHVTYLANERVIVASTEKVCIRRYNDLVARHPEEAVTITEDAACADGVRVRSWCVQNGRSLPDRADDEIGPNTYVPPPPGVYVDANFKFRGATPSTPRRPCRSGTASSPHYTGFIDTAGTVDWVHVWQATTAAPLTSSRPAR